MQKPAVIRFDATAALEPFPDFPESEISSGARDHRGHLWVDDTTYGLSAGVWETEANLGRWMQWPVHEFMIILDGEVVMFEPDGETVIGPGESFFIPKGRRCVWNQSGYAKKFMLIFDDTSGLPVDGSSPILKVDPGVLLQPIESQRDDTPRSAVPLQRHHQYFEDGTGQLSVGVGETMERRRDFNRSECHELVHVLRGDVIVGDEDGGIRTFTEGDTFLVPLGASGSWESEGTSRFVYCSFAPRSRV
jgi:uncharacterized cupin superfamily protein